LVIILTILHVVQISQIPTRLQAVHTPMRYEKTAFFVVASRLRSGTAANGAAHALEEL
jgi:hypothetical protein